MTSGVEEQAFGRLGGALGGEGGGSAGGGGDGDGGGGSNGGNYLALPSALARAKRSVWSARECVRVRVERDAEASQEPTTPPTTRPPACVDKKAHRCRRLEQVPLWPHLGIPAAQALVSSVWSGG